jgi:outer membrane lipoprotein-sorting protein
MKRQTVLASVVLLALSGYSSGAETAAKAAEAEISCESIFAGLKATFDTIEDYRCTFESYASDGKMSEKVVYEYFFKRPRQVRMKILSGKGSYNGTVLLYTGNKVKVHTDRGMMSLFSFCMGPDNKKLLNLRNHGIHQSDWGWFIDQHIESADLFDCKSVSEETVGDRDSAVYELVSRDPAKTEYLASEKLWVDKKDNIIVKYAQYDIYGNLMQSSLFKDIALNSGLDEDVFFNFKMKE